MTIRCSRLCGFISLLIVSVTLLSARGMAADPLRPQAVVNLTFDEESGDAADSAAAGAHKDDGKLMNNPRRVASPFWNQAGKQALLLDAGAKQFVQLADSADTDRPDAVTLSFFFLSLHDLNDAAFHGIIAKRTDAQGSTSTNYGINYNPKADSFQVYINDGGGFRVAQYSVKSVIGYRRLVHLTATFEVGDAPAPDEDAEKDDVLIRLFLNGQSVKPASAAKGTMIDNDVWLVDVNTAGLLNDVPLTIGGSTPETEFTSSLFDELLIFPRALTLEEAAALFIEVAGPNAAELAKQELEQSGRPIEPQLAAMSLRGLQVGQTTRLTITGQNLAPQAAVDLAITDLPQMVAEGSNAGRLVVDVTVPAETPPGFYPLRVRTAGGVSNPLIVAVDRLPQFPAAGSSEQQPSPLPGAFSGQLSGAAQPRLYFQGAKGARIVAEVEAKRLGAAMDPVIEVKTARGTPLAIEWSQVQLRGDARAEVVLPADGLYFVELHDLTYKAPGQNSYRLKVGDLKLIDAYFPAGVRRDAPAAVQPIGTGLPAGTSFAAAFEETSTSLAELLTVPPDLGLVGPAPPLRLSDAVEVVEAASTGGQRPTIDARFADEAKVPIVINGQIASAGERDVYPLDVTAGQKLNFKLDARAIDSPLDAELAVLVNGNPQIIQEDRPGSRDPAFDYTAPANAKQIQVAVRDLYGRGGPHFIYRLRLAPAGQPDFNLTVTTPRVNLPENGTAVVQLQVNRSGYGGPIRLSVLGDPNVSVMPNQLSAEGGNRSTFVTLARKTGDIAGGLRRLTLVGESVDLTPALRRLASVNPDAGTIAVPGQQEVLPSAITEPTSLSINFAELPAAIFRGTESVVTLNIDRADSGGGQAVRLTLSSNEAPRQVDPNDAKKGTKPLVAAPLDQTIAGDAKSGPLRIAAPLDVAAAEIDFVVKAEIVPHAYSNQVAGVAYSPPFRLPVHNAAAVSLDANSLALKAGTENKIAGTVKRTAGFTGNVSVALAGLPQGYSAPAVAVPPDQEQFELIVTVPAEEKPKDVPNVTLAVSVTGGGTVLPPQPVALKVK